jgi:5-methylcytosine-specific restriction endonuclease McrA
MTRQAIPGWVRRALLRMQRHTCQMCGRNGDHSRIEVDHIIPIALGGSNDFSNLQLLCLSCNRSKGARLVARPGIWQTQRAPRSA